MLKEAIKRRNPGFNETYYGFRVFGNLLEEAQARGLLELGRDEKSGAYVYRSSGTGAGRAAIERPVVLEEAVTETVVAEESDANQETRRKGRGRRKPTDAQAVSEPPTQTTTVETAAKTARKPAVRSRRPRKPAGMPDTA